VSVLDAEIVRRETISVDGVLVERIVPTHSPEAGQRFRDELTATYCSEGHDGEPGGTCRRCAIDLPPLNAQERITQKFCPDGCLEPTTRGTCARCGRRLTDPDPLYG
jgi:hypothetical protein